MSLQRLILWVALAMSAFAANSLLCRMALTGTAIDPASFTSVRLASGALMLWLIVLWERRGKSAAIAAPAAATATAASASASASALAVHEGNWISAAALFAYAIAFSYAYQHIATATGALLLFGSVQAAMIFYGLLRGERLKPLQTLGLLLALSGLVALMLPKLEAPPLGSALLMCAAGAAWGVYSLRGKKAAGPPTWVTAGNFWRAVPMALAVSFFAREAAVVDGHGLVLALLSGAVASGMGYAVWYRVMPHLPATSAATVQLSVPVIAALGGALLLGEALTLAVVLSSVAILGGIGLVIWKKA